VLGLRLLSPPPRAVALEASRVEPSVTAVLSGHHQRF